MEVSKSNPIRFTLLACVLATAASAPNYKGIGTNVEVWNNCEFGH